MTPRPPPLPPLGPFGFSVEEVLGESPHGFVALGRDWQVLFMNAAAEPLLGCSAREAVGRNIWELFPEAVDSTFHRAYARALQEQVTVELTEFYEPLQRWFDVHVVPHSAGLAVYFHDVTALKEAERSAAQLAAMHEGLRTVASAVAVEAEPEMVFDLVCAQSARLVDASAAWIVRFVGGDYEVLATTAPAGKGWPAVGHRLDVEVASELDRVRSEGVPVIVEQGGSSRLADYGLRAAVLVPVHIAGELWGALSVAWEDEQRGAHAMAPWLGEFADLAALAFGNAQTRLELTRLAAADPLTDLANVRQLHGDLDRRIDAAERGRRELSLVVIDIDNFKSINDRFGHETGDTALCAVADRLRALCRPGDLPARVGGDEFAVVLDRCDAATALKVAERIRVEVGQIDDPALPRLTISAGVCGWEPGLDRKGLQRRADNALYWAKVNGRNAVRLYADPTQEASSGRRSEDRRRSEAEIESARVRAELQEAQSLWQAAWDGLSKPIAVIDQVGRIVAVNAAWRRFAQENGGDPERTGVGANYLEVCAAAGGDPVADRVAEALRALLAGEQADLEFDYACHAPGQERWFSVRASRFGPPTAPKVIIRHEDITARRQSEQARAFQTTLLNFVGLPVFAADRENRIVFWNPACEVVHGRAASEVMGKDIDSLGLFDTDSADLPAIIECLRRDGFVEWDAVSITRDGRRFPSTVTNAVIRDADGNPAGFIGTLVDTSERERYERNLEAARDYLHLVTESISDGLLVFDSAGVVTFANRAAKQLLGHGQRLLGMPVSRALFGSDAAAEPSLLDAAAPEASGTSEFVTAGNEPLVVDWTASSMSGAGSAVGLPVAQYASGSRVVVFRDAGQRRAEELRLRAESDDLRWEHRMRAALRRQCFVLFAQPIVVTAGAQTVDHELLIRLRGEDGALIPPGEFLPRAESQGFITEIDRWVTEQAVTVAAAGQPVHYNLSARSVGDPDLLEHLRRAIQRTGADPGKLTVELTETALVEDRDRAAAFADQLRQMGCHVALDDFGAGYNSFARIKEVRADVIKIDRQFVSDLVDTPSSESVIKAILSFASELGIAVVAEGVEDEPTSRRLVELGVPYAQGFFYGRPAPLTDALSEKCG